MGSGEFYPNFIPTGPVPNFCRHTSRILSLGSHMPGLRLACHEMGCLLYTSRGHPNSQTRTCSSKLHLAYLTGWPRSRSRTAKVAILIAEAPEEIRDVLAKIKISLTKADSIWCLGATFINNKMLGKTLAYLMDVDVMDKKITRLLKEGKKEMIFRQVINMMPLPCITCNNDA